MKRNKKIETSQLKKRVQNYEDVTAEKYKEAVANDKKILWNWGLIK